jgi:hypothetical protein
MGNSWIDASDRFVMTFLRVQAGIMCYLIVRNKAILDELTRISLLLVHAYNYSSTDFL